MKKTALLLMLLCGSALAQTRPNWSDGSLPIAVDWHGVWQSQLEQNGSGPTGGTTITIPDYGTPASGVGNNKTTWVTAFSGGLLNNVASNQNIHTTLTGAPIINVWNGLDQLTFSGTGGIGQHVARYAQTTRYKSGAGGASNNPQLWAMVAENDDFTGLKSSQTNASLSIELDLRGHNVDDSNNRQLSSGVIAPSADNSNFFEATGGYNISVSGGAYAKSMFGGGGAYTVGIMDFRYAASYGQGVTSLNNPDHPSVTSTVTLSTTIPVTNIMPFTSDTFGRDLNLGAGGYNNSVFTSDGQTINISGYTITGTGPTPTGIIISTSPATIARGIFVTNNSRAVWFPTGSKVTLDTNGATSISSDATTVKVIGALTATNPIALPVYTVAGLPTCSGSVNTNALAAVSDATSPAYNAALTGSGAVHVPVFCNGKSWTSH